MAWHAAYLKGAVLKDKRWIPTSILVLHSTQLMLQAQELLGTAAEEIAQMRQAGREDDVKALVKKAQFTEWVMTISAKSREWEGKRNMRYACHKVSSG
jgi:hypothetical protein